jgi:drug/metabolite transporter (DMT)-like permease
MTSLASVQSRLSAETAGWLYGFIGVVAFSLTLPATRVAVTDLNPWFVAFGRVIIAAILSAWLLRYARQPLPSRAQWRSLVIVGLGVVIGFPLLSAIALRQVHASHSAIVTGLLPLATALVSTLRAGERPSRAFWFASALGSGAVILFAWFTGDGHWQWADVLLVGAVIAAGFGYAEGGRLARTLGSWQVICWALVLTAPFLFLPMLWIAWTDGLRASPAAWLSLGYVSVVSQFLGFFAWYRGLALGGVAKVSQVQLLQPFLTLIVSAWLLREAITPLAMATALVVLLSIAWSRRATVTQATAR